MVGHDAVQRVTTLAEWGVARLWLLDYFPVLQI